MRQVRWIRATTLARRGQRCRRYASPRQRAERYFAGASSNTIAHPSLQKKWLSDPCRIVRTTAQTAAMASMRQAMERSSGQVEVKTAVRASIEVAE